MFVGRFILLLGKRGGGGYDDKKRDDDRNVDGEKNEDRNVSGKSGTQIISWICSNADCSTWRQESTCSLPLALALIRDKGCFL